MTIKVDSMAASIASVILMAGSDRTANANATVMVHDTMGGRVRQRPRFPRCG